MARRPRFTPAGYPLHITQRGNYRQPVFFSDPTGSTSSNSSTTTPTPPTSPSTATCSCPRVDERRSSQQCNTDLHLVITPHQEDAASRFIQRLTGQYTQYLHGRLRRKGRLWQSRFYSCVLDRHHFFTALTYVDLNPTRAAMVNCATGYHWSSAAAHCNPSAAPAWLDLESLHNRIPHDLWRERLAQPLPRADIAALRKATHTEQPLGLPGFLEELETKFQTKLTPQPLGRPKGKEVASESAPPLQLSSAG